MLPEVLILAVPNKEEAVTLVNAYQHRLYFFRICLFYSKPHLDETAFLNRVQQREDHSIRRFLISDTINFNVSI